MTKVLKSRLAAWQPAAEAALHLGLALLIFGAILLNRSPNLLRPIAMNLRAGFALTIPIAAVLVYLAFRLPGWFGRLAGLTLTMSLFAFPLAGLWASGETQSTVLSGLIPLFDASQYYVDALRLLAGQDFSDFSARRPIFPGVFAALLALTGRNFMATLAVFTAITGLACYVAAREIQRTHGAAAGVFVLVILFLFYRAHSGVSMSENLGVPLGALGMALLWRGAADRSRWLAWGGLFVTTLALNARAGAFFVLPALIVWYGWYFRPEGRRISWRITIAGSAAVAAGFAINFLLVRLLASPTGVPFANFSYTLYGIAAGGHGWHHIFDEFPELLAVPEPEHSRRIYQMAFELIRSDPGQFLQGLVHSWGLLFSDSWYSMYAYVAGENRIVNLIARWGLFLLCLLGIYRWFRGRSDPFNSLVLAASVGVFLSVPFLPPTDGYRMRPYAASIIVFGLLPAMGVVFLLERRGRGGLVQPQDQLHGAAWSAGLAGCLTAALLAGPLLARSAGSAPPIPDAACEPAAESLLIRFDAGTSINIHRQNQPFLDWMPDFHIGLFRLNVHSLAEYYVIEWFEDLSPPISMFYTLDLRSNRDALVLVNTALLPRPGSTAELCGSWESDPLLADYHIFHAQTVQVR